MKKKPKGSEDITLEPTIEWIGDPPANSITSEYLEYGFRETIRALFGEYGASAPLQVESYDAARCHASLRLPADTADSVTAALALCTELLGAACVVHVHGPPPVAAAPKRYFGT